MDEKKIEVTRKYNETAEKYDSRYKNIQTTKYLEVFSNYPKPEKKIILDVGGGTGLFFDFLEYSANHIICSDISINMLRNGKKKFRNGCFVCADSENLPFKKNSMDLITSFSMIQNLENPLKAINQMNSMLKTHGNLILTVLDKRLNVEELENIIKSEKMKILKLWKLSIEDIAIIARKD